MNNSWFSKVEDDIYVRRYAISRPFADTNTVTVYAICSKNEKRINNDEYFLEVYFSVDEYDDMEFLIGITFGKCPMDKKVLDAEINGWVEHFVREDSFPQLVSRYQKRMELYEEWSENEEP